MAWAISKLLWPGPQAFTHAEWARGGAERSPFRSRAHPDKLRKQEPERHAECATHTYTQHTHSPHHPYTHSTHTLTAEKPSQDPWLDREEQAQPQRGRPGESCQVGRSQRRKVRPDT